MHVLKSRSKRILNGLGNLSLMTLLMLWLTACATNPGPVGPPTHFYEGGCGAPARPVRGLKNEGLVRYIRGLQDAVVSCETDRAAIRDWADKVGKL